MFQIDLNSDGDLILYHHNKHVEISATPAGIEFIKTIIMAERKGIERQLGWIGTFPTQHFVNNFLAKKNAKLKKEQDDKTEKKFTDMGINLKELDFDL
jgi:hypothetical protein